MPSIMIVDDEPVVRQLLRDVLTDGVSEVHLAGTATEAMLTAHRAPLDVVLVDKNLPDRSGLKLIEELKRLLPDAEAILITAYASLESAIEAMKVGACGYLVKPFDDITTVADRVREALDRNRLSVGRKRVLQELLDSDDRYRLFFEGSDDAIILHDAVTGAICDANEAALRLLGYGRAELLDLDVARLGGTLVEPFPGGSPFLRRQLRKDGSEILVEVSSTSFLIAGRPASVAVLRDITRETIDLEALLAELQPRLQNTAGAEVAVAIVAAPGPCLVRVRRPHLVQVLLQFCTHARAALADGGTLTFSTDGAAHDPLHLPARRTLTVTGNGGAAVGAKALPALATLEEMAEHAGGEMTLASMTQGFVFRIGLPAGGARDPR